MSKFQINEHRPYTKESCTQVGIDKLIQIGNGNVILNAASH